MRGRDDEIRLLVETAHRSLEGERTIMLIDGPPGIGKTALVNAAARRLRGEVIRNQATATGGEVPLQGLRHLIERVHRSTLDEVLDGESSSYELSMRCIDFLDRHAVTLIVDDVHSIDDTSCALLERILVAPTRSGGIVMLVHRPDQLPASLIEVLHRSGLPVDRLTVTPLGDTDPGDDHADRPCLWCLPFEDGQKYHQHDDG